MLPWASISGLPELPPTMSLLVEMQKGVRMSRRSLTFIQLSGILKGEEPVARCEGPVEVGEGLHRHAVLRPARHRAVIQAQRECGVGIYLVPKALKRAPAMRADEAAIGASTASRTARAQRARIRVERARQLDHRIARLVHRGLSALPQLHADRGIVELRFRHHAGRERSRAIP